ncbi:MAG TPA: prolipoprotein diacylglyceryl transferase family protein [Acidimicrobiales bacterium]|nr:prolipoprotein diacylglyceryl transferase family protein [Acidimicrobiales bacterium]
MKPIPVAFHIGPLEVHTYGIGLAITFWFAYRYFDRRLQARGYPTEWLTNAFVWIIVTAIAGARLLHVLANLSAYTADPVRVFQVWQGGLSSFGGLLGAVPTGLLIARRRCPELGTIEALDIVAPVLMAAWGVGRLLGPQLMVAGGGHPTHAWFGMAYAGQSGKRLPVPIFQAFDSFVIYGALLWIERHYVRRPVGFVLAAAMALWGLTRFYEERLWLGEIGKLGSDLVQVAGLALFAAGVGVMVALHRRQVRTARTGPGPGSPGEAGRAPEPATRAGPLEPLSPA